MRQSVAGIALIARHSNGQRLWLAQWNDRWKGYHFVGGHKRESETFRQCVMREVEEELHLSDGSDFVVARKPTARLEYDGWSDGADEETHYTIELFDVALQNDAVVDAVGRQRENRWLSEPEISHGRSDEGLPMSRTMKSLMQQAGLTGSTRSESSKPM